MLEPSRIRMAVQKKGRLTEESLDLLRAAGLELSPSKDGLFYRGANLPVDLILVRDDDIPRLVADSVAQLGIVGQNVLAEYAARNGGSPRVRELCPLGFSRCRLSIALPEGSQFRSADDLAGKRVATTFPGLLSEYLNGMNVDAQIVELKGSVEMAPRLDLADAVCDLVATGSTLEANGLVEVETVFESEAVIITGAEEFDPAARAIVDRLMLRIRGVQASFDTKYVMLNAPVASLPEIRKLLPGADAPTVIALQDRDDIVAIHAVCRESVFWETMEDLNRAGASAILVVPIEKMIL